MKFFWTWSLSLRKKRTKAVEEEGEIARDPDTSFQSSRSKHTLGFRSTLDDSASHFGRTSFGRPLLQKLWVEMICDQGPRVSETFG
jgi:hypothetical protein